jgi:uncharacterized protein YvpB
MKHKYSTPWLLILLVGIGLPFASPVGGDISLASQLFDRDQTQDSMSNHQTALPTSKVLNVPIITQNPDLPKGCEVTSLAMLLQFAGVKIDKLTLAEQMVKVPYFQGGLHGDPNQGFVGNMFDRAQEGYGVYHQPIAKLAEKYLPNQTVDLSGSSFDDVLHQIAADHPVWVIVNMTFQPLANDQFVVWNTPEGNLQITYLEHAVVITGYDQESIYINDPLSGKRNQRLYRTAFQQSWEQMGKQAVSIKD